MRSVVIVFALCAALVGFAVARPDVPMPRKLADVRFHDGRACWKVSGAAGCNVHGCWDGPRGSCNVHGCSDTGTCTVDGCPGGRVRTRTVCVAEDELPDVLGYDPDGPGGCNVHGCWDAGGGCNVHGCWTHLGGCNVHGCWNSPLGACNVHGCSERGACSVHGCP